MSSLDDSGLSVSESSSGTCSPAAAEDIPLMKHDHHEHQDRYHEEMRHQDYLLQHYSNFMNPEWMHFAFSYLSRAPYSYYSPMGFDVLPPPPPSSHQTPSSLSSPISYSSTPKSYFNSLSSPQHQLQHPQIQSPPKTVDLSVKSPKKSSFTISAILGCDDR